MWIIKKPRFDTRIIKFIGYWFLITLFIVGIVLFIEPLIRIGTVKPYRNSYSTGDIRWFDLCVVIGVFLILITIFGFVITNANNYKYYLAFAIMMWLMSGLMIISGIALHLHCDLGNVKNNINAVMNTWGDMVFQYELQNDWKCCGQYGQLDYYPTEPPVACCQSKKCLGKYHHWGCEMRVTYYFLMHFYKIALMWMMFGIIAALAGAIYYLLASMYVCDTGVDVENKKKITCK